MSDQNVPIKHSRKELEKQQRRLEILKAALTIFVQKGYHNTTLDEVAQLAEFGKGTLYNYFQNKEDLFYAILEHQTSEILTVTQSALRETQGSLKDKLRAFALATVQHGQANKETFGMIMQELHQPNWECNSRRLELLGQGIQKIWSQLADLFKEEIHAGRMRNFDVMNLAALLDAMIRMYVLTTCNSFWPLDPVTPEASVDMALDVFFNGVGEMEDKG